MILLTNRLRVFFFPYGRYDINDLRVTFNINTGDFSDVISSTS